MYRWLFSLMLYGFVTAWAPSSMAQPAVVASTLFQQAVSKMEAGDFAAACPILEESYRLDAKSGTLFTLANCRDRQGKVATASARYGEYLRAYANMPDADQQKHAERAKMSETRMQELAPQLPTLKLVWQGELPADVKIFVDGVELAGAALSHPLPLDPGEHVIAMQQPAAPESTRAVALELGRATTFDLDTEFTIARPSVLEPTGPKKTVTSRPKSGMTPQKTAGIITIGIGGASLVFGGVMGALALAEKQTVKAHCTGPAGLDCDATGFSAVERMRTYVAPSTAGFIAGGVLAAAGVVLVVTAPARSGEKPMAMTLRAQGTWGGGVVGVEGVF